MIRGSVEACLKKVPNRFDVIKRATQRAKNLSLGVSQTDITLKEPHKNTVVALIEIAEGDEERQDDNEGLF